MTHRTAQGTRQKVCDEADCHQNVLHSGILGRNTLLDKQIPMACSSKSNSLCHDVRSTTAWDQFTSAPSLLQSNRLTALRRVGRVSARRSEGNSKKFRVVGGPVG
jgi:hypothetical protein